MARRSAYDITDKDMTECLEQPAPSPSGSSPSLHQAPVFRHSGPSSSTTRRSGTSERSLAQSLVVVMEVVTIGRKKRNREVKRRVAMTARFRMPIAQVVRYVLGCRCLRASLPIPPHPNKPEPHSPLLLCHMLLLLLLHSRHVVAAPRTQVDRLGHLHLAMLNGRVVGLLLGRVAVGGRRRVLPNVGLGMGVNRGFRRVMEEGGAADRLRALAGSTGSDDEEGTDDQDDKDGCNDTCELVMSSTVVNEKDAPPIAPPLIPLAGSSRVANTRLASSPAA